MCVAAQNRQKFTKILYCWGLKSFKVIHVDNRRTSTLVFLMTGSMFVFICNSFYTRRANSGHHHHHHYELISVV